MSYSLLTWVTMPLLSASAMAGLYVSAFRNDLFPRVDARIQAQYSSGINPLQKLAATMVEFFTPILDTDNLSLHVLGIHFIGLLMSAWILILVESYRRGPQDRSKSLVLLFGLLMEFLGVAIVIPWWCLVNLSSTYLSSTPSSSTASLLASVPLEDAKLLPWSLLIGVGIPSLLMQVFRMQSPITITSKQFWIIARLFHPIFTLLTHRVLRGPARPAKTKSSTETLESAQRIRTLLTVAFWVCALPHILIVLAVSIIKLVPERFPASLVQAFAIQAIWPVTLPWDPSLPHISTIKDGVAIFLFWDEAITAVTILSWALIVSRVVLSKGRPGQTAQVVVKTLLKSALYGPSAAAVLLIQEKDDAVLSQQRKIQ